MITAGLMARWPATWTSSIKGADFFELDMGHIPGGRCQRTEAGQPERRT